MIDPRTLDVGTTEQEIPAELRQEIETYMRKSIKDLGLECFGTPFDLAVDTAYDMHLVYAEKDWEIPVYVVEIVERMFRET